ncbi:MAG: tetraacyldisaccharide 4'-kinase [Candidatus Omnitrophota bacterium]
MKKLIGKFLASIYGGLVSICQASYRLFPFRIKKVNAWVISIGNITWGGTGKTPLVISLAKQLSENGKKIAVLTRGYGQDEVAELKKHLPAVAVLVGRDRVRSARQALKDGAEVLILDDGFQHIRLHRDVDVVNINSTIPFGPGGLIPQGTLREPLENLARANIFVLTKANIGSKNVHWIRQKLQELKPNAVIFEAVHKPIQFLDFKKNRYVPLTEIKGKNVAALSGIGDPYSFEKTVENLGARITFAARFDDHHLYNERDLLDFARRCRELQVKDVVTTEKDFYRIEPLLKRRRSQDLSQISFWTLQIECQVHDEEDFIRRCLNS